jgi:hypothetical protein
MVKLLPELTALFVFVFVDTPTDEKPPVLLFAAGTEVRAGVELFPDAAANEKLPVDGAAVLFSLLDAGVLPKENPPGAGAAGAVDGAGAGVDEPPNEKTITKSQ